MQYFSAVLVLDLEQSSVESLVSMCTCETDVEKMSESNKCQCVGGVRPEPSE